MQKKHKYRQRTDFLWQSVSFYGALLVLYSVFRGSVSDWTYTIMLKDPIVLILVIILVGSSISTLARRFISRTIIVKDDALVLKTRFGEKSFSLDDIRKIQIKKRILPETKKSQPVILITVQGRNKPIHVNPAVFKYSAELTEDMMNLKKNLLTNNANESN